MTHSQIEEQLAALEPVTDDELAARILCALETRHCPVSFPTQVFSQVAQPTQYFSCFASTFPLLTGIAGGLIGAAVMFFAVTFFMQPKVEIREVVRYVAVEVPAEQPISIPITIIEPHVQPTELPKPKPQPPRTLPWVLAWLSPFVTEPLLAYSTPTDVAGRFYSDSARVDAMIEQRARLAKNAANFQPLPQLVSYEPNKAAPSEFSPIMYREMIDKMSL